MFHKLLIPFHDDLQKEENVNIHLKLLEGDIESLKEQISVLMEGKVANKDTSNNKDGNTDEMETKMKQLQRLNTKLYIQVKICVSVI